MNFLSFIRKIINFFIDFLFPKTKEVIALESLPASTLLEKLPRSNGLEKEDVVSIFDYSHPVVKEIIWEIKYGGNRALASKLGEILYDVILSEIEERNFSDSGNSLMLIPMPISGKRRFERGWNQAELIAKEVKTCDSGRIFRYEPGQLVKIIHTESQTRTASKKERENNLERTMSVTNPSSVRGRAIILVDDVVTTGSTFREARRALKEAGAKKILCVALAH